MKTLNFPTSACRYCRHYDVEGRRGGMCQQLGVSVRGNWKACSLALPVFTPSWESIEEILQDEKLILKEAFSVNCSVDNAETLVCEEQTISAAEKITADIVLV